MTRMPGGQGVPCRAQVAGQLGDLRAGAWPAVGIQRRLPGLSRQHGEGVENRLVGVEAHRILQPQGVHVVHERVHPGTAVPAHQHPAAVLGRQLRQRVGEHPDVVGGVVGRGPAGAQQPRDRLAGPAGPVVEEGQQRVEAERALPRRGGALLLRVRSHDRGVQVDDHRPLSGKRRPQLPDPGAGGGPSSA
jgi:hypothetical protein